MNDMTISYCKNKSLKKKGYIQQENTPRILI